MTDTLNIAYEEFPEEGIKVLTVGRGEEALWQFEQKKAEWLYKLLTGELQFADLLFPFK